MGGTIFPKEIFRTSQRFAQRIYLIYWNERPKGGHFAAFEQPDIYGGSVGVLYLGAGLISRVRLHLRQ